MFAGYPIRQIAYVVADVEAAAVRHSPLFGSGPFFVISNYSQTFTVKGRDLVFNQSSSYGQWGSQMVEFLQSNEGTDPGLAEIIPVAPTEMKVHHVALLVDDSDEAKKHFAAAGFEEVMRVSVVGSKTVWIDTREAYGHLIEIYDSGPQLTGFYDMVAQAAKGWDGKDVLRRITL